MASKVRSAMYSSPASTPLILYREICRIYDFMNMMKQLKEQNEALVYDDTRKAFIEAYDRIKALKVKLYYEARFDL